MKKTIISTMICISILSAINVNAGKYLYVLDNKLNFIIEEHEDNNTNGEGTAPPEEVGSLNWLIFLKSQNQLADLNNLYEWNTLNENVNLASLNLTNSSLPQEDMGITDIFDLSILSNDFDNLDFLKNIEKVNIIKLYENTNLTNIRGLRNINSAQRIELNTDTTQYLVKPIIGSDFCNGVLNNNVNVFREHYDSKYNIGDVCQASGWLALLHSHNTATSVSSIFDIESSESFNLSNKSLNDSDLNLPPLGSEIENIFNGSIAFNNITNLDFLQGIKTVDTLNLTNNKITNTDGLSELTKITNSLALHQNTELNDIRGLRNLAEGTVVLSQVQFVYDYKPNLDSSFCQGIISGDIQAIRGEANWAVHAIGEVCVVEGWLGFMHGLHLTLNEHDENNIKNLSFSLHSKDITNAMLPTVALTETTKELNILNLQSNNLTNISFLDGLEKINTLNLHSNNISDISALSQLTEVTTNLALYNNLNLKDIRPLSNISSATMIQLETDPDSYDFKPLMSSPFCKGLDNGSVRVVRSIYTHAALTSAQLCVE